MKHLPVNAPAFLYAEKSFKEWLDILGYAPHSVYSMPNYIREFFHYMERNGKTQLTDINNKQIKAYYQELKTRPNLTRGGGLSSGSLNKHQQALQKFSDYLRQSGRLLLSKLYLPTEEDEGPRLTVLTVEEIKQLYKATEQDNTQTQFEVLALRDRAMLAMLYGCGLRRNEAVQLDVSDIDYDKKMVYVRKGKNYKERYVPISTANLEYLRDYQYDGRPMFLREKKTDALFISQRGKRIGGQTLLLRLHLLIQRVDNAELHEKEITLHTLRHSIATHLLEAGMKLENIARFLGHSSLESTQIYTHIIEQGQAETLPPCDIPSITHNL